MKRGQLTRIPARAFRCATLIQPWKLTEPDQDQNCLQRLSVEMTLAG